MEHRLRDATGLDLEEVLRINNLNAPAVSEADIDKMRWYHEHCAYFRVATGGDERIRGFLNAMTADAPYWSENFEWFLARDDDFVYVDRIAIDEPWRRAGLGRVFYEDVERFARENGIGSITCEVNVRPRNEASLRFHEAMGFRGLTERETAYGPRVLMLEKILDR